MSSRGRVLVTGANGFVGRPLCRSLAAAGYSVRGTTRASAHTVDADEFYAVGDIGPNTNWTGALRDVDIVVHLAAQVHVMEESSEGLLAKFRSVNVAGTERLARAAATAGVRRIVYVSSVKVNGESTKGKPFKEADPPEPRGPYAISKWEAEQRLCQISKETGIEVVILRPPLVYGPEVKANFLSLMKLVDRGLPLPLGSVDNRRSLLYVGNLTGAITACIAHPEAAGKTFLLSDGEDVSTSCLIRRLAWSLGKRARLVPFPPALMRAMGHISGRSAAVERILGSLEVDSSKIRCTLGWQAPYTLEEGLKETVRWFESEARR